MVSIDQTGASGANKASSTSNSSDLPSVDDAQGSMGMSMEDLLQKQQEIALWSIKMNAKSNTLKAVTDCMKNVATNMRS